MTTIFSKIISKEIPADIVYEDENILAFLDINPVNPGHTLVIPKEPSTDGLETNPEVLSQIIKIGQRVAQAQKKTLGCPGVNFVMNNGEAAGQEVFHTHLHVIPRYHDDKCFSKAMPTMSDRTKDKETAALLASVI